MRFTLFACQLGCALLLLGLTLDEASLRAQLPSLNGVFDQTLRLVGKYLLSEYGLLVITLLVVWGPIDYSISARKSWGKKFKNHSFSHITGTVLDNSSHVEVSGSVVDGNGAVTSEQHNIIWVKSSDGKEEKLSYSGQVGQNFIRKNHHITAYFLAGNWIGVNNWTTDKFHSITTPSISNQLHLILIIAAGICAFSGYGVTIPLDTLLSFDIDLAVVWLTVLYLTDRLFDSYRINKFWGEFNRYWDSVQSSSKHATESQISD